jgi:hypothetical protein
MRRIFAGCDRKRFFGLRPQNDKKMEKDSFIEFNSISGIKVKAFKLLLQ